LRGPFAFRGLRYLARARTKTGGTGGASGRAGAGAGAPTDGFGPDGPPLDAGVAKLGEASFAALMLQPLAGLTGVLSRGRGEVTGLRDFGCCAKAGAWAFSER
jgi:hypothetical protein